MSMSRHCVIYKATDDKWYLELAPDEYGEWEDAYTYGPFSSLASAEKYLTRYPNPGALDVDEGGTMPPPTQSPNGELVQRPARTPY